MKFVHIADTHLGLSAFNRIDPDTGMNMREAQIYANFLLSADEIVKERPDAVVHAGDLFDHVKPKTKAYTTALEALERFSDAGIPLILIAGNHSMPKTRYTDSPFKVLKYHHAQIYAAYQYRYEKIELDDTTFHLIPNMLRPEDYGSAYNDVSINNNSANVLVTHGLADQIKDRRLATVAEHELNSTILSPDFTYIALGHYHNQYPVTNNAWYSGSPEFFTYGEIDEVKGGLVVDTNSGVVEHFPLPHTPMTNLGTIDCSNISIHEVPCKILENIENRRLEKGSMAIITLTGLDSESAKLMDMKQLSNVREHLLDLKVKIIQRDRLQPENRFSPGKKVDYIREFDNFIGKTDLSPQDKKIVLEKGIEVLNYVISLRQEKDHDT